MKQKTRPIMIRNFPLTKYQNRESYKKQAERLKRRVRTMGTLLLSDIPAPLGLLGGLLVFLAGVLLIFWFFMARNNPKSQNVDTLPPEEDRHTLQGEHNLTPNNDDDAKKVVK